MDLDLIIGLAGGFIILLALLIPMVSVGREKKCPVCNFYPAATNGGMCAACEERGAHP